MKILLKRKLCRTELKRPGDLLVPFLGARENNGILGEGEGRNFLLPLQQLSDRKYLRHYPNFDATDLLLPAEANNYSIFILIVN